MPSFSIDAVMLATPRLPADSNWSAPPTIVIVNDTSGRSCFSETMRSAPLSIVVFVHVGTRRTGSLPGGGIFERSSVCWPASVSESATIERRVRVIAVSPALRSRG
ncbi:MAG: hypothetical protein DMF85_10650 [Acidobacteria bacterium]|nr:MAG: hypothetical protein DMF85_10650 [Acidobacteriota bacterium]